MTYKNVKSTVITTYRYICPDDKTNAIVLISFRKQRNDILSSISSELRND